MNKGADGLCKYCLEWSEACGLEPAHCANRARESWISCDLNTNFAPFRPVFGLPYTRDEIVAKWTAYTLKRMGL